MTTHLSQACPDVEGTTSQVLHQARSKLQTQKSRRNRYDKLYKQSFVWEMSHVKASYGKVLDIKHMSIYNVGLPLAIV